MVQKREADELAFVQMESKCWVFVDSETGYYEKELQNWILSEEFFISSV